MELLTTKEMAAMLQVCEKTLRRIVKEKGIPFYRAGREFRFNPDEVLARLRTVHTELDIERPRGRSTIRPEFKYAGYEEFAKDLNLI